MKTSAAKFQSSEIKNYFDRCCQAFGNTVSSVGWFNRETQRSRFNQLCNIAPMNGESILDIGCGLGDMYAFLCERGTTDFRYCGVDLSEKMINTAKQNFPEASFEVADLFHSQHEKKYDYVLCSGALNFKVSKKWDYIRTAIIQMYSLCNKGLAFNLLSAYAPGDYVEEGISTFQFFYPEDILSICFELTRNVNLLHGYLPNDFTVHLYK